MKSVSAARPAAASLRVAALVDLPRGAQAGGHAKAWERLAQAATNLPQLPLQLTVFFAGQGATQQLAPTISLQEISPVFSTASLKFLPYLPDHTDLAGWHPRLAKALTNFDVVHTTDGFFCMAQTAAKLRQQGKLALTNSFHTDTPAYARLFTARTIQKMLGEKSLLARLLLEQLNLPAQQEATMLKRLQRHLQQCDLSLASRPAERQLQAAILGPERGRFMRLGVDKTQFHPRYEAAAALRARLGVAADSLLVLFVGRLDEGKNIYTLLQAMQGVLAAGHSAHLICAGVGPAAPALQQALGPHVTLAGYVPPAELAGIYASVDVLAMVSEVENRSQAMAEALASGCPVLVAAKNQLSQLFAATPAIEEVTGGAAAWQAALTRWCITPDLRQTRRSAATDYREHALPSWEDVVAHDLWPAWQAAAARLQALTKQN